MPRRSGLDLAVLTPSLLEPAYPDETDIVLLSDDLDGKARIAVLQDADSQIHRV
jgi:hypothetical protein